MEEPSNETIYAVLLEIQKQNKSDHAAIIERQDKTNGDVASLKVWRGVITGGLIVISGVIIPIIMKVYF